ncbi:A24 family peptidase [Vibrio agarivorans]|uniref:A24 family peptidase n=1 Tax=Vibrio agarivorans TaxID=153622 RepID=UPI0025B61CB1|nr:A24 family peptidase [Vibrio agarivorans]MDN3662601.1 A24 family peptidase [Vibrio agarivorans]
MFLLICAWTVLFLIGLFDARENRIPNSLVLSLALIGMAYQWQVSGEVNSALLSASCGALMFLGGLVFYFLKLMAPGDVKLMGAVGCFVGWSSIGSAIVWIAVATVLIGTLYITYFRSLQLSRARSSLLFTSSAGVNQSVSRTLPNERLLMPFAPVVVVGVALSSYFN